MGTTADKLTYLNTTKGKIKDSINLTGANIGSNDTFRSYAVKLRDGLLDIINNGTATLYNNFPKVSGTGSNISLSNTLEAPMNNNKFDGDTYQQTYSGKNKFNINTTPTWIGGATTYSINNNVLKVQGNWYVGFLINIKENTDYYLSVIKNIIISQSGTGNIAIYKSNKQTLIKQLNNGGTFNSGDNNEIYLVFYSGIGNAGEVEFSDIQLEEGNSATSYEPYVGGTSSPNPDYPQEIQCVEGIQNITIGDGTDSDSYEVNLGKNLLNAGQESYIFTANTDNGRQPVIGTINLVANTKYYISYDVDTATTSNTRNTPYLQIGSTIIYQDSGTNKNLTTGRKVWEYTPTTSGTYSFGYWSHTPNVDLTVSKFMISISSNTDYVPYRTPIKLYDGDYITGAPDNWSIERVNGEVILDGTQKISIANWRASETSVGWVYAYNVFNNAYVPASNVGNIISNKLIASKFDDLFQKNKDNGIAVYINTYYSVAVRTSDITLTTIQLINNYLSNNPIKVVYELATPTTEQITDTYLISQLNALYYAKSCNGQTNISVSGNLPMILEVSALKDEI